MLTPEPILEADIAHALPSRPLDAHKGDFGRVLVIGGAPGMPGAARLAGEACLRVGAGLVTCVVAPQNVAAIVAGRPELICLGATAEGAAAFEENFAGLTFPAVLERADVIAIGPGLGRSAWARGLLEPVLRAERCLVIDADALNLIAANAADLIAEIDASARSRWILTPHPGEAARLLRCDAQEIQRNRLQALERLVNRYECTVVLKGAGSLVGAPGRTPQLCERGNPGMASAGMGDVLTGAIAGIYAQCHDAWQAACVGVLVHAMAGDKVAQRTGVRGLLAADVATELQACVNP